MKYDVKMQEAYIHIVVKECKIFINLYNKIFYSNCTLNAQALYNIYLIYWSVGLEGKIEGGMRRP
jgi:hypothetical protein